ncbi:hydrolase or acyltransferase (alpha beta hydrolase superfamily) [Fusarium subglutinans]|uniref:Hydrolase or acyltransferase (Alpha beta hydrolase superfamily) n=1 Tax=Gibberella subglutinans TaxID=42677 RepID=A0A8H5PC64_GIBSU|nr:hydrolase or acyltransferase (alpha beta hydrolase superfamily) [Fusarium subglutinans]KAF5593893.1 hydrolase or acyltransferase (alpha beta hydrolase superfamily) [Fusarium subglutinans]
MTSSHDPTTLTQSFHYETSTHSYDVKWGSLGDPKSPPLIFIHSWNSLADWTYEKAHIVAHDNAGLVSLRGYILHDLPYASLCLIDVVAIGPFGQPLFKVIAENPKLFEQLPDTAFGGILESYISDAAYYELPKETMQMLKEPWLREGGKRGFIRELCQANSRSTEEVEARYGEVGPKLPIKINYLGS